MKRRCEVNVLSNDEYCSALRLRVSTAYKESKNSCGWRLLASPSSVLEGADIAFIGLNPGGSSQPDDHAEFAMEQGSAYVVETWGGYQPGTSPLQTQVRALFSGLSVEPESVLAGNLVPFRSPNWKSLERKDFSLRFGESLWGDILQRVQPGLVIGMGRDVFAPLSRILGATGIQTVAVGWGKISAIKATFPDGSLVVLPHLSRFGFVTREKSAGALRDLFDERWRRVHVP
jgi:hypothetical protein